MITGREKEQKKLRELYDSGRAEFVAVYGRKRVGKTYLIDKNCHFALVRRERLLREIVPKKASIQNTLITTFGLKQVEYFGDFASTITLDDLFRAV